MAANGHVTPWRQFFTSGGKRLVLVQIAMAGLIQPVDNQLSLTFMGDTVTYRREILPTGSIACMAMNIGRKTVDAALPLCQRIALVNTMLRTGVVDKASMNNAGLAAHVLLRLIAQHEPFTFFTDLELDRRLDLVFTLGAFKKIHAYNSAVLAGTLGCCTGEV